MTKLEETLYTALQYLYHEQNGPPLEKRKDEWQEAMNIAKYAMRQFEKQDDAAPDLLEALQRLDDYYTRPVTVELSETDEWAQFHRDVLTPARAALAKARGEV